MDETERVIEGALVDGQAGACVVANGERGFEVGLRPARRWDIRPRNHDFGYAQLAQIDGAENEALFTRREQAAFARLLDLDLQLFDEIADGVTRAAWMPSLTIAPDRPSE